MEQSAPLIAARLQDIATSLANGGAQAESSPLIAARLQEIATSLANQADRAAQAAAEQQVREGYGYTLTKAKTVLQPPFLVAMVLYPSTIAVSLKARSAKFGLLIPTPASSGIPVEQMDLAGPNNKWSTVFWFVTMMLLHAYILMHLRIRGPPGAVKVVASLAWLPTISFWCATATYFIAYMSMSRYAVTQFDAIFTGICSGILLVITVILLFKPLHHEKNVVRARNTQAPENQVAA